eukprot:gene27496-33186_t
MWRSRRIRPGVPVSALNCLMRRYRVLSCLRYKTKLSMSVASYHATIIKLSLFCGTLSPGYARIIKKQVGSRQGA